MQLITTPEFLEDVDEWRRHQPDIPGRSVAIRRMVAIAAGISRHEPAVERELRRREKSDE